jgi:hypothetical protein
MKIFLFFTIIFIVTILQNCSAQYPKPEVIIDKKKNIPQEGKALEYSFIGQTDSILKTFFTENEKKLATHLAFIEMSKNANGLCRITIYMPIHSKIKDEVDILLSSTNRFYSFKSFLIPIVFDFDSQFAFPSFAISHYYLSIDFELDSGKVINISKS